jgi:hypothetical protein
MTGVMLKEALFEGIVYCPHAILEPDYDICPECNKSNPLGRGGFI